jgi:hypothetical protein
MIRVGFPAASPAAVVPYRDTETGCAVAAIHAMTEQIFSLSKMNALQTQRRESATSSLYATDPTIEVYVSPGSSWTSVSGRTASNTLVTMHVLRNGRQISIASTSSNNDGWYNFYPSWQSCPSSDYNWTLKPGDVAEVTANEKTARTIVANLSAWVDPNANSVTGKTDPGRSVNVQLYMPSSNSCSGQWFEQDLGMRGDGTFSTNMSSQADFNRRAAAYVYAKDTNANATYAWFYAYQISAALNSSSFEGYIKPNTNFLASLRRNGTILSTYTGISSANNYFYGRFGTQILADDVIHILVPKNKTTC